MTRRPALFTQADIARALRAVKSTGEPGHVEIKRDGTILVVLGAAAAAPLVPADDDDDSPIVI